MNLMKEAWRFYLAAGLFSATRMGIGATAVVYMLSKGVSLSDIAMIKIIQGFIIFFMEVPTGLVADLLGRRFSIILSVICAVLSFFMFFLGESVMMFAGAEVFNALAIAFWSGAFEALVVENYESHSKKKNFLEVLFSRINMFMALATMLGGLAGGFIGEIDISYPFLFSAALGVLTIVCILKYIPSDRKRVVKPSVNLTKRLNSLSTHLRENLRASIKFGIADPTLRSFFALQVALQFMYQPVFHYWQPYFKEFGENVSTDTLGLIFFTYVAMNFLVSWVVSEWIKRGRWSVHAIIVFEISAMSICFAFMATTTSFWWAVAGFLVMQGSGGNLRSLLSAQVNKVIPSAQRATILSSVSFVSRIGMLVALGLIHVLAPYFRVSSFYFLAMAGAIIALPIYYLWHIRLANHKEKEEFSYAKI